MHERSLIKAYYSVQTQALPAFINMPKIVTGDEATPEASLVCFGAVHYPSLSLILIIREEVFGVCI